MLIAIISVSLEVQQFGEDLEVLVVCYVDLVV